MWILWFVVEVLVTAVAAGLAAAGTIWGWNLVAHGAATVDWATAARIAILLGAGLPVTRRVAAPRRCS